MYPGLAAAVVEYQPMSPAIDGARLGLGDRAIARQLVIVFIWSVSLIVVFIYPAIRIPAGGHRPQLSRIPGHIPDRRVP